MSRTNELTTPILDGSSPETTSLSARYLKLKMDVAERLEEKFKLKERDTSIRQELNAGVVLFCTTAYMFVMNPNVMAIAGFDKEATYLTTVVVAIVGTTLCSWFYNLPLVIAPAMGLNSLMAVEIIGTRAMPVSLALGVTFAASLLILVLSQAGLILPLVRNVPTCLKKSIIVSLGLFQAVIALKALGVIEAAPAAVPGLSQLGVHLFDGKTILCLCTTLFTISLVSFGFEGSLLYGILAGSIAAWAFGCAGAEASSSEAIDTIQGSLVGALRSPAAEEALTFSGCAFLVFLVIFVDMAGVLLGLADIAKNLQDPENGLLIHSDGIYLVVSLAGIVASLIGCSPPVILLESMAGVSSGARTGLAGIFCVFLFTICLLAKDLVTFVPPGVSLSILLVVGSFMMGAVTGIEWNNITEAFPSYVTITATIYTCSLANGTIAGFLVYVALSLPHVVASLVKVTPPVKAESVKMSEEEPLCPHRKITMSDWTQMGLGTPKEISKHQKGMLMVNERRTMSVPELPR